tara:strand:+ start:291 stop:572 length:282 start_codon:yes stop_codon:yes gene_type:complete
MIYNDEGGFIPNDTSDDDEFAMDEAQRNVRVQLPSPVVPGNLIDISIAGIGTLKGVTQEEAVALIGKLRQAIAFVQSNQSDEQNATDPEDSPF